MKKITVNNVELSFQSTGEGTETIVFSHGYLMDNTMFQGQINALKNKFRCISYDHRGHGKSEATDSGYELDNLVNDAIGFIEALNIAPVHFVGMSTGGFIGMRIALRRPDLLKSLVLMDTSADAEPKADAKQYDLLMWIVKYIGWWAVINKAMPILFHKEFLQDQKRKDEVRQWKNIIMSHNKKAVLLFGKGIFSRGSVVDKLSQISLPTAVIVGAEDIATKPDCAKQMADAIDGAQLYTIANAGHSAAVEKPQEVAQAMQDFYASITL